MAKHLHKGWFVTATRPGDRTVDQQLVGLDNLMRRVSGQRVLDVGCAEGLIDFELAKAGAASVHGVEIVASHIAMARDLCDQPNVTFEVANADTWGPTERYDVVLLLAILHKLQDPSAACRRFVAAADKGAVIRLPPTGPVIVDARSGSVPHDIGAVMSDAGFDLEQSCLGTFDEWIGYFSRRKQAAAADEAKVEDTAIAKHSEPIGSASSDSPAEAAATETPADSAGAAATSQEAVREETTGDATPSVDKPADKATDAVESGRSLFPSRRRRGSNEKGGSGAN